MGPTVVGSRSTSVTRKLIEVALPLEAINKEAAREKSIRHGHPSTLHLWWARRPLAACRAVLFAQLVDDPSAHPDHFPTEEVQDAERKRLFRIIEELVKWENSTNERILEAARAEIRACFDGKPPPVLDPFCGGGSIPLEAQRLGLEAYASDLNPVAVLITKAIIEIPPKFAGRPPVHPKAMHRTVWQGSQGLAEDVRRYGAWVRDEAEKRVGHLYPKATLPDGSKATVIAWLWARTVTCPNPACRSTIPLVRSFWLGKRKGKEAWVRPVPDARTKRVRFEIGNGPSGPPVEGTVNRNGANCLVCNTPVPFVHVRAEGKKGHIGAQLMAIVAEGHRQRLYLPPNKQHERAAEIPRPEDVPETELPAQALGFRVQGYGMTHHADLFTNRQLNALCTFSDLVIDAHARVSADGDAKYADAVATYLAFALSKLSDRHSTLTNWYFSRESTSSTFQRQALAMLWDYAETNPLLDGTGTFENATTWTAETIEPLGSGPAGTAIQADAVGLRSNDSCIVSTDPPYYDNIGYADLSDYFYVWLRRCLRNVYPDLFSTVLTPKSSELVATPFRFGGDAEKADAFFESGFERAFEGLCFSSVPEVPLTLFYAFKQAEESDGALASTGWETMLAGLFHAGLSVTATWPMRTEASNRMVASGTNALASSIVLACRPRPESAGITDRRGFLSDLHSELPHALRDMQKGNIAPVDLAQASIGPGMAVFSRYARVVEGDGTDMTVRTALGLINQVLDEVLAEQEGEFDPQTRWAIKWFEQSGFDDGPYGTAEVLATATGTAVASMQESGILKARAGKVHLLDRGELKDGWDPAADSRTPVWEVTMHLVKRHQEHGEEAASDLLRQVGGLGDAARDLAYRLYSICDKKNWASNGLMFNALVTSWPEIARPAAGESPTVEQGTML
jgi:putative DNA methylase